MSRADVGAAREPDAPLNADAASGFFVLEWLAEAALPTGQQGALRLAPPEDLAVRLRELARAADDLERRDEEAYLAGAEDPSSATCVVRRAGALPARSRAASMGLVS